MTDKKKLISEMRRFIRENGVEAAPSFTVYTPVTQIDYVVRYLPDEAVGHSVSAFIYDEASGDVFAVYRTTSGSSGLLRKADIEYFEDAEIERICKDLGILADEDNGQPQTGSAEEGAIKWED